MHIHIVKQDHLYKQDILTMLEHNSTIQHFKWGEDLKQQFNNSHKQINRSIKIFLIQLHLNVVIQVHHF